MEQSKELITKAAKDECNQLSDEFHIYIEADGNKKKTAKKSGRPRRTDIVREKGVSQGLHEGWIRKTFILRSSIADRLTLVAKKENVPMTELIDVVLTAYLDAHDKENEK